MLRLWNDIFFFIYFWDKLSLSNEDWEVKGIRIHHHRILLYDWIVLCFAKDN